MAVAYLITDCVELLIILVEKKKKGERNIKMIVGLVNLKYYIQLGHPPDMSDSNLFLAFKSPASRRFFFKYKGTGLF